METNLLFGEVASMWKENRRNLVKYTTYCNYSLILKTHLLPKFGQEEYISERQVQEFVYLKLQSGLARKTVRDIVAVLKAIVKYGAKHSIFRYSEWDVKYPTESPYRRLPVLSKNDHKRLLNALATNPTTENIGVMIALCCGLRIGEVCALRWENVDLQRRMLSVGGTLCRIYNCETMQTGQYLSSPKTRSSNREVPISPILLNALRVVKSKQKGSVYVVGEGIKAKEPRGYRDSFKRLLKQLNISPIVFHGLRHTFATRCIESECDYKTVSAILGHSNVATTLNLYVHPGIEQKKRCLNKLNKYLGIEKC